MTTIYTESGVALKVDGKIAAHADCCCIETVVGDCCDGIATVPKYLKVTFTDENNCPDDCTCNGTYILEFGLVPGSPCAWRYSEQEVPVQESTYHIITVYFNHGTGGNFCGVCHTCSFWNGFSHEHGILFCYEDNDPPPNCEPCNLPFSLTSDCSFPCSEELCGDSNCDGPTTGEVLVENI